MGDITIEKDTFHDRLSGFISHWKSDKRAADGLFNGANSIIVPIGKANDATDNYSKTAAFQLWLLGYEFPATIIALTTDGITFVTTKKKAIYLEPLKGGKVAVDVLVRGKDADANKAHFAKCVDVAKAAGSKVGVIAGEPQTGPFVDEWKPVCDELLAPSKRWTSRRRCRLPPWPSSKRRSCDSSATPPVPRATCLEPSSSAKSQRSSTMAERLPTTSWPKDSQRHRRRKVLRQGQDLERL